VKKRTSRFITVVSIVSILTVSLFGAAPVSANIVDNGADSVTQVDNRSDPLSDKQATLLEQAVNLQTSLTIVSLNRIAQ
jgi:hypothetical protein